MCNTVNVKDKGKNRVKESDRRKQEAGIMQELDRIILIARELNVSDIHMSSGMPLLFRIHGNLTQAPVQPSKEETDPMLYGMLNEKQKEELGQG